MEAELPAWLTGLSAFLLGAVVGSFLNVVIYRLPMSQSIVSPGSHCFDCGSPVRPVDNVPLVSWLVLMGQCRDCGATISSRYFFVELLTAVLTFIVVGRYGPTLTAFLYLVFVWGLIAVTFIDIDFQIIPDELSVGGAVLGLAVAFLLPAGFKGAVAGALVGGGIFFALAILYPGGMGGGDIKLMAAIGAFLGWRLALLTIILGSVFGAVVGLSAMAFWGKGRKSRIPFGPFLAAAAVVSLLWGDAMISAYLSTFI